MTPIPGPGPHPATSPPPGELVVLRAGFPCFRIWREETFDRARYVARSLHLRLNPHTVITDDISELRAALEPARHAPCPRPHPPGQGQPPPEPAGPAAQIEQAGRAAAAGHGARRPAPSTRPRLHHTQPPDR
jgi:hypothetical protein